MRSLVLLLLSTALSAFAQLPELAGYAQATFSHNLPLPVKVVGGPISEQDVPAILFVPTCPAARIEGARVASSIPGLPATLAGYRLVVLPDAVRSPISLRDGRMGEADVPVFAYEPIGDGADVEGLRNFLATGVETKAVYSKVAAFAPPARSASVTAPAAAAVTVAASSPAFAPEPVRIDLHRRDSSPAPAAKSEAVVQSFQPSAEVLEKNLPATWDEALAPDFKFNDRITVGDVIVDERQSLRHRLPVRVDFASRPLSEVLLSLAAEAGIDFSIGSLPADTPITTRFNASPFAALEQIARQFGVGLYHEKDDPLWVIRRIDPETLIAHTYKLQYITLGTSSGASGDKTFGSGFSDGMQGGSGSRNGNGGGSGSSSSGGALGTGSTASAMGSSLGTNVGASTGIQLPHQAETFGDRFSQPSDVLFTIKSILGLIEEAPMVSEMQAPGTENDPATPRLSTRPAQQGANKVNGLVSYNSDTGTLFVVGTEKQQAWVSEYLRVVDQPMVTIAIDALFVESDAGKSKAIGADWSSTFVDWNVSGPTSLAWGSLQHPSLPTGSIIETSGFSAKLSAYMKDSKSRIARYPRAVTSNNREVRIATTSNIPILSNASTTSSTAAQVDGSTGTISTSYSAGTQEIGTIITILPSKVGNDKVHLKISIEISSGGGTNSGEQLTGRIATNSTTYEGEIQVPAGRTLAIGGLERIAQTSGIGRVAGLSSIPVFGFLFAKREADFSNTNITLFITPRFIDGNALPDASARANGGPDRAIANSDALERQANAESKKKE